MPVFDSSGSLSGALTISGPIVRLTAKRSHAIMSVIRAAGMNLTKALGGHYPSSKHVADEAVSA
jgi:DNA-binding IclR family transcriptional regulator